MGGTASGGVTNSMAIYLSNLLSHAGTIKTTLLHNTQWSMMAYWFEDGCAVRAVVGLLEQPQQQLQQTCLGQDRAVRAWLCTASIATGCVPSGLPASSRQRPCPSVRSSMEAHACGQGLVYSVLAALPGLRCALEAALRF